ncbi:methylmalonyl-CoA mutase family protein [Saccharothrix sp. AJ9571]|nr:methylmalonyl-CoA mutase family protein [Saccharothrix sp. AJ9571]
MSAQTLSTTHTGRPRFTQAHLDLPTQTGYDADHKLAKGKVGVPVAHIGDMRRLFDGIPFAEANTSMTINAPAMWLLLPADHRARALGLRPTGTTWLAPGTPIPPTHHTHSPSAAVWTELLERSRTYLAQHAHPGALGSPGAEADMARANWDLAACESMYRRGRVEPRLAQAVSAHPSVERLRELAGEQRGAELVALAHRLREQGGVSKMRRLAGTPLVL